MKEKKTTLHMWANNKLCGSDADYLIEFECKIDKN